MSHTTAEAKKSSPLKKVLMGNHAVSWGARLCRVKVISAYPITPQTQVVEMLSEMCAKGELDAKFIPVESEHSAMAALIGAASTGVRTFTATSSHGLLLMHEMIHWAAGARLPIVMAEVNRAIGPGWNIWADQGDSLSQRDTGWMQCYVESNQEVLDTIIQGYKIAETLMMPLMVVLDAFYLSHTYEPVEIPDQSLVDEYLPPYTPPQILDPAHPHAFGGLVPPEHYMEMRYKMQEALERARPVIEEADGEFGKIFGRSYGLVEPYRLEDAEAVLVTSATATGTARTVIDRFRNEGKKVGLLKIRLFRPFPTDLIRRYLHGKKRIGVLDRNIGFGAGGIFAQEVKAALCNYPERGPVLDYIAGLGGRDITPATISAILNDLLERKLPSPGQLRGHPPELPPQKPCKPGGVPPEGAGIVSPDGEMIWIGVRP